MSIKSNAPLTSCMCHGGLLSSGSGAEEAHGAQVFRQESSGLRYFTRGITEQRHSPEAHGAQVFHLGAHGAQVFHQGAHVGLAHLKKVFCLILSEGSGVEKLSFYLESR